MAASFKFRGARAVASRPVGIADGELWAKNASGLDANDGTVIDATLLNEIVANLRALTTALGTTPSIDDDHTLRTAVETYVTASLSAKAPLASPAFTGMPTAPTASTGTNTTQLATTAFVAAALAALVDTSPAALDTLNELAAALGDDANFAATVTTALAGKQPLDADLTAIAALATTAYGRSLLEAADAAALRTLAGLGALATAAGVTVSQISDASANGRSLISAANYSAMKTLLAIAAGDVSGLGALATASSVTASQISDASANGRSLISAADYAAMKVLLALSATDSPQFAGVNVGHASDTPVTRAEAGVIAVAGLPIYPGIPQNAQSAAYTTVLADAQKHILHPAADNNERTFTIAANASVAYPVGTCLTFVNEINTVTIAINSDTLTLAGTGATGSRTLAANGIATALKLTSTKWIISGVGLT